MPNPIDVHARAHARQRWRGIWTLVIGLIVLPVMDAIAKHLSTRLPTLEIAWGRYVVYAAVVLPLGVVRHGSLAVRPTRPGLQIVRGALMALSAWAFFASLARMPLADAMAVFFAYPAILLALSTIVLRERVSRVRWILVAVGFGGALMVARPTFTGLGPGAPFALMAATTYATAMICTRTLALTDPPLVTAAMSAVSGVVGFSIALPFAWVAPTAGDVALLALVGIIAAAGHVLIAAAYRYAPASALAPFGYTELPVAALLGWLAFGAVPTPVTLAGMALIVGSGILAARSS